MPLIEYLLLFAAGYFSACIGSFANVVIFRSPSIFRKQAAETVLELTEFLGASQSKMEASSKHELPASINGRSKCQHCLKTIPWYHNLPIIGWLMLFGKSACCGQRISFRYFFNEALLLVVGIYLAFRFGVSAEALAIMTAITLLVLVAWIDFDTFYIPDWLSATLLITGMFYFALASPDGIDERVLAAAAAFTTLAVIRWLFYCLRGVESMGAGDPPLFMAITFWCGSINALLLFASLFTIALSFFGRHQSLSSEEQSEAGSDEASDNGRLAPIPFGPGLSLAGIIYLLLNGTEWHGVMNSGWVFS